MQFGQFESGTRSPYRDGQGVWLDGNEEELLWFFTTGGDRSACIQAGVSRAYLAQGDEIRQLTYDHSLVQEPIDAGKVNPVGAGRRPNANV